MALRGWQPGLPRRNLAPYSGAGLSAQGVKGAKFETSLLPILEPYYPGVYRLKNQGAKDKGDYKLPGEARFIIQAKNWQRLSLGQWVDAATQQAANAGVPVGVVFHKRKGTTDPREQFVTLKVKDFLWLMNGSPSP